MAENYVERGAGEKASLTATRGGAGASVADLKAFRELPITAHGNFETKLSSSNPKNLEMVANGLLAKTEAAETARTAKDGSAGARAAAKVANHENAIFTALTATMENRYDLTLKGQLATAEGVAAALNHDVEGMTKFTRLLGSSPEKQKMGQAFTDALNHVGVDAHVSVPESGDSTVNFGRLADDLQNVAETVTFSSTGEVKALNQPLPPREPLGPQNPESSSPRRAEDVLLSVVDHALIEREKQQQ